MKETKRESLTIRLELDILKAIDDLAGRSSVSRSEIARRLLTEGVTDPYQILEGASQGEFSSEFLNYLVSLNDSLAGTPGVGHDVSIELAYLREWLLSNPYHPNAAERVRAVVAHSCRWLLPHVMDDAVRLEKIIESEKTKSEYQRFESEHIRMKFQENEKGTEHSD